MDKIPQVYQQRNTFYYKVNINGHRVTRKAEGSTLAQAVESGRNEHDSSAKRDTIAKLINIVI